jgi:hypothetical protein
MKNIKCTKYQKPIKKTQQPIKNELISGSEKKSEHENSNLSQI